jgi:hypothetical protein
LDEEKIHITPAALRADALFSLSLEKGLVKKYKPHMLHLFGVIGRPPPMRKKEFCFDGWISFPSPRYPTLDLEGAGYSHG